MFLWCIEKYGNIFMDYFIVFILLHLTITIGLLAELYQRKIPLPELLVIYFFPPILLLKILYVMKYLSLYNSNLFLFIWHGFGYLIPFFNLPYPFLYETFKVYVVSAFFFIVSYFDDSKPIKLLSAILSFIIEPEIFLLLSFLSLFITRSKSQIVSFILATIFYAVAYTDRMQDILNLTISHSAFLVNVALLPIVIVGIFFILLFSFVISNYIDKIIVAIYNCCLYKEIKISGIIRNHKMEAHIPLLTIILTLLIAVMILMIFQPMIELYVSSHYVFLIFITMLSVFIFKDIFVTKLSVIFILVNTLVFALMSFGLFSMSEFFSRMASIYYTYILLYNIYDSKHHFTVSNKNYRKRALLALSVVMFSLFMLVPWLYINFPGGPVDYTLAFKLADRAASFSPPPFLVISDYSNTYTYFSRMLGLQYIWVDWRYDFSKSPVLQEFLNSLSKHGIIYYYDPGTNILFLTLNESNKYIIIEVNYAYKIYVNEYRIDPKTISEYQINCGNSSIVKIKIDPLNNNALVRYRVFQGKNSYIAIARELLLECKGSALLIASQQVCNFCGMDSWQRALLIIKGFNDNVKKQ
jgi:hypothetical protein